MTDRKPEIEMVSRVTIEHGLSFAQGWYEGDGDISDACDETGIMTFPEWETELKEVHFRYHDLTDEICANVFGLVKRQIAEAFVRAANEVLDREKAMMNRPVAGVPIAAFTEAMTNEVLAINGLHVLTFKPSGSWTAITLMNGDTVTVAERFDDVLAALSAVRHLSDDSSAETSATQPTQRK
jgi:hypothetical protein